MKFDNVYFFNGTAYAGKSTMVKCLAEKYGGIACEENYHDSLMEELDWADFPNLAYTQNWKIRHILSEGHLMNMKDGLMQFLPSVRFLK